MNNIDKLRVVIVDDEQHGRETIKTLINRNFPDIEICGEADSVVSAVELLKECKPDILFLDIELTDGTGFDLLEALEEEIQFQVIFATAFNYYAIKAIRFSALDYLLKPVDVNELINAIENAKKRILTKSNKSLNLNFLKKQIANPVPDKIALPSDTGYIFVSIEDIIRCQAESNYTSFVLLNNKTILISRTLKEYEDLLKDNNFFRIHNSHLINMSHVRKYYKGKTPRVLMSDGTEVEVSTRRKDEFLRNFTKL